MEREEAFILQTRQPRRIMIDLYETTLTPEVVQRLVAHIGRISSRVHKLGISAKKRELRLLQRALHRANLLKDGQVWYGEDMEDVKTWLVQ